MGLGSPATLLSSWSDFIVGTQVVTERAEVVKWIVAPRAQSQREREENSGSKEKSGSGYIKILIFGLGIYTKLCFSWYCLFSEASSFLLCYTWTRQSIGLLKNRLQRGLECFSWGWPAISLRVWQTVKVKSLALCLHFHSSQCVSCSSLLSQNYVPKCWQEPVIFMLIKRFQ